MEVKYGNVEITFSTGKKIILTHEEFKEFESWCSPKVTWYPSTISTATCSTQEMNDD